MVATIEGELFGWEVAHRSDKHHMQRKVYQLIVDLITFCVIGIAAVGYFLSQTPTPSTLLIVISVVKIILLIFLGFQIVM
jgi:hypothetical protein